MIKKKVALLLSGQLRTFDDPVVRESWNKFFNEYDVTTFLCCWKNRGRSVGGTPAQINIGDGINEEEHLQLSKLSSIFQTENIQLLNFNDWLAGDEILSWMQPFRNSKFFNATFSAGYMRMRVGKMLEKYIKENDAKFDGVFLTRPDMYFIKKPFQNFFDETDVIFHQNSEQKNPQMFVPDRIYDVLLFSSQENVLEVCNWYNSEFAVESVVGNYRHSQGLAREDPCWVLFVYFALCGIKSKSLDMAYAEVFRNMTDVRLLMGRYYPSNEQQAWCLGE